MACPPGQTAECWRPAEWTCLLRPCHPNLSRTPAPMTPGMRTSALLAAVNCVLQLDGINLLHPVIQNPTMRMHLETTAAFAAEESPARADSRCVRRSWSLLCCAPLTGRTHQIRVHVAHMGHPIASDDIYGLKVSTLSASCCSRLRYQWQQFGCCHTERRAWQDDD